MNTDEFQKLLLKSAVSAMAADGVIEEVEISEIKNIAENEIYFMGFAYLAPLENDIDNIRKNGKDAITELLDELANAGLNENQKILLIEVLIRVIESDDMVDPLEIKFINMVRANLNISEEDIILKFPNQVKYLVNLSHQDNYGEFHENITIA